MRRRWLLVALVVAGLASACGGGATPPSPPATSPAAAAGPVAQAPVPAPLVQPKEPESPPPLPPLAYDPKKRRDPFVTITLPTPPEALPEPKGLSVGAVKLVGIVAGRRGPLALVEAPDGIGYILKPGDMLGDGRVTAIGSNAVDFALSSRPGQPPTTISLRLGTD